MNEAEWLNQPMVGYDGDTTIAPDAPEIVSEG